MLTVALTNERLRVLIVDVNFFLLHRVTLVPQETQAIQDEMAQR